MDFVRLVRRDVQAPYTPFVSSPTDTRNCPDEDEIDIPTPTAAVLKAAAEAAEEAGRDLFTFFPEFEVMADSEAEAFSTSFNKGKGK